MRVLAFTRNASLVVALDSMMRDWEVVTVRDVAAAVEAGPASAVGLIDLGDTDEGLQAAEQVYRAGVTIPFVVIGDVPADAAHAQVLVRPFSLEDLGVSVRESSARARTPSAYVEAPATEQPAPPAAPPREADGAARTAEPREEPAPRRGALSVVPPAPEDENEDVFAVEDGAAPVAEPPVDERLAPIEEPAGSQEPAVPAAPPQPVYEPPQPVYEPPQPVYGTPAAYQQPAARSAAEPAAAIEEPWAPPTEPGAPPSRWRLRRRPRAEAIDHPVEAPLVRRLKAAAAQAQDLQALIDELPFLADLAAMADGLVGEVEAQFETQIASVFVRNEEGFYVVAHRGLSRVEAGMVVPETQPLFSDVLRTGEGILIQPVDLAQGLVAGIGGSRTEAIMAAPAVVHGECVAIVVAGSYRFDEADLDRLSDLAAEAAPGLAVAQLLERLRAAP